MPDVIGAPRRMTRAEKIVLASQARENAVAIAHQIAILQERRDRYNREADRLYREAGI